MRVAKRLLLFVGELGILVFGLILSLKLAALASHLDPNENTVLVVFFSGCLPAIVGIVVMGRKIRRWRIEYDAVGWLVTQAKRKLHPTRARYKRILGNRRLGAQRD